MFTKSEISKNLQEINKLFLTTKSQRKNMFYSKLAVLELCGWTEVSMDDIVTRCAKRKSLKGSHLKVINKKIDQTWGFEYEKHFVNMLTHVIGYSGVESIEKNLDNSKHIHFVSTLDLLKDVRNRLAHTYTIGITPWLDAPSITIKNFAYIYDGLLDFDRKLRLLGH
jgi:hypothetical protein